MTDTSKKSILVVDDSAVIRSTLLEILSGAGYEVETASNGVEGIEKMNNGSFDLLCLDIDMPNLSGLSVCRMLRENPRFKEFPIVMLTARSEKSDQYWGKETGADEYLTKPVDSEKLLAIVGNLIEPAQAPPADEEESHAPAAATPPADVEDKEETDVIFRANEMLETKLFKMSLVNKIYQIATSQLDLMEACSRVADIFASVIEFDLATFLIADEEQIKLFLFVQNPVTRSFLTEARKEVVARFREMNESSKVNWENIEVETCDPGNNLLKEDGCERIGGMRTLLLESTGERFGLFNMARGYKGDFKQNEMDMCNTIAAQSALVINNVRMYEKIRRFAIADGLTGLNNHRYFQEQMDKEFSRARRFGLSLSMIMLDLDDFKTINDTYGHQQGDIILKDVATLMRRSVRDIDLVARYGGEEFTVMLPETPKKNSIVVAERIRSAIEEHEFQLDSGPVHITASLGISGRDDDPENKKELIAKADEALYKAKRQGKNRVCLWDERSRF